MTRKVRKIEKMAGGGLLVELADGSRLTYSSADRVPDDVAGLLSRMDAADAPGGASGGPGDLSAVDRYRQRLQNAYRGQDVGRDPYAGLSGVDRYRAEMEGRWSEPPAQKARFNSRKHWAGA